MSINRKQNGPEQSKNKKFLPLPRSTRPDLHNSWILIKLEDKLAGHHTLLFYKSANIGIILH